MRVSITEKFTNDDEVDVEIDVEVSVDVEHDPYGTGDSPTSYEVQIISCASSDGNDYGEHNLPGYCVERITQRAIEEVRGY